MKRMHGIVRLALLGAILALAAWMVPAGSAAAFRLDYDALGRLTKADTGRGWVTQYTFDASGNLLKAITSGNEPGILVNSSFEGGVTEQGVAAGWAAYATKSATVGYSVVSEAVYGAVYEAVYAASSGEPLLLPPDESVSGNVYEPGPEEEWPVQRIILEASAPGGASVYQDAAVAAEASYTLSGYIQAGELAYGAVQVVVNYYDGNNRLIGHKLAVNVTEPADWTLFTANLTAPAGAVKARIHLQALILEAGGLADAGFAAIVFEPGSAY